MYSSPPRVFRDLRFADFAHVGAPRLFILLPRILVRGVDGELVRVDVCEFSAVAVAPARQLLFVVVVVGRGEEVAEDHFGDVDLFFLMDLDRDASAVVVDGDGGVLDVDFDFEGVHVGVVDLGRDSGSVSEYLDTRVYAPRFEHKTQRK